jgi:hypothetical protein
VCGPAEGGPSGDNPSRERGDPREADSKLGEAVCEGKSYTPLNAAQGTCAAHPIAALGQPIFRLFGLFCSFSFFLFLFSSSFMFPFSAIIYIIIF